jgi:hypothetical protein
MGISNDVHKIQKWSKKHVDKKHRDLLTVRKVRYRKRHNHRTLTILVAILVIVVVLGFGYLEYQSRTGAESMITESTAETSSEEVRQDALTVSGFTRGTIPVGSVGSYTHRSGIQVSTNTLTVNNNELLSLIDVPSSVLFSGRTYRTNDQFISAAYSPNKHYIAYTTHASGNEFGWIYDTRTDVSVPVVISLDGKVKSTQWNNTSTDVIFYLLSKEDELSRDIVSVDELPDYIKINDQ